MPFAYVHIRLKIVHLGGLNLHVLTDNGKFTLNVKIPISEKHTFGVFFFILFYSLEIDHMLPKVLSVI